MYTIMLTVVYKFQMSVHFELQAILRQVQQKTKPKHDLGHYKFKGTPYVWY